MPCIEFFRITKKKSFKSYGIKQNKRIWNVWNFMQVQVSFNLNNLPNNQCHVKYIMNLKWDLLFGILHKSRNVLYSLFSSRWFLFDCELNSHFTVRSFIWCSILICRCKILEVNLNYVPPSITKLQNYLEKTLEKDRFWSAYIKQNEFLNTFKLWPKKWIVNNFFQIFQII